MKTKEGGQGNSGRQSRKMTCITIGRQRENKIGRKTVTESETQRKRQRERL